MLSPRGWSGSTTPMQPRNWPPMRRVTKTPRFSAKAPWAGICAGQRSKETAWTTAPRASRSKDWRSSSERNGILGLLAGFEHAQRGALREAVVEMPPELQEIRRGGNWCADDHEPEQEKGERR